MPGPVPKNPKLKQRRNKSKTAKIIEGEKKRAVIPELPERKGKRQWRQETIAWWKDIWNSPMAPEFIQSDIHRLYILADLVDAFWRMPAKEIGKKKELANEIRLQGQCFGLTPLDRRRLEWQIEKAESANAKGQKRRNEGRKVKSYKVDPRSVLDGVN